MLICALLVGLFRSRAAREARRLAVVLHRMWVDGTEFSWSNSRTAVEPLTA
jgi:hypothetical protein